MNQVAEIRVNHFAHYRDKLGNRHLVLVLAVLPKHYRVRAHRIAQKDIDFDAPRGSIIAVGKNSLLQGLAIYALTEKHIG